MKLFNYLTVLSILTGCAAVPATAVATTSPVQSAGAIEPALDAVHIQPVASDELAAGRLRVSGHGKLDLRPDLARISLSVHARSRDSDKAVAKNAADTERLLAALTVAGIGDGDLKTAGYEVFPSWDRRGFVDVDTVVEVTVRDLPSLGKVLAAGLGAGATTAHGIEFDVADRDAKEKAAMKLAVADARSRGEALAAAAGRTLGAVTSIDTVVSNPGQLWLEGAALEGGDIPIAPGSLGIEVEVIIAFALTA